EVLRRIPRQRHGRPENRRREKSEIHAGYGRFDFQAQWRADSAGQRGGLRGRNDQRQGGGLCSPLVACLFYVRQADQRPHGFVGRDAISSSPGSRALVVEIMVNGRSEEHTSELQSLAYLVCR